MQESQKEAILQQIRAARANGTPSFASRYGSVDELARLADNSSRIEGKNYSRLRLANAAYSLMNEARAKQSKDLRGSNLSPALRTRLLQKEVNFAGLPKKFIDTLRNGYGYKSVTNKTKGSNVADLYGLQAIKSAELFVRNFNAKL